MDFEEFKKAYIDMNMSGSRKRPKNDFDFRVMSYLSQGGRAGTSFRVLCNRMKINTQDKMDELAASLHRLHQSGHVIGEKGKNLYRGSHVIKWHVTQRT
jgi:hypothetical protein